MKFLAILILVLLGCNRPTEPLTEDEQCIRILQRYYGITLAAARDSFPRFYTGSLAPPDWDGNWQRDCRLLDGKTIQK